MKAFCDYIELDTLVHVHILISQCRLHTPYTGHTFFICVGYSHIFSLFCVRMGPGYKANTMYA